VRGSASGRKIRPSRPALPVALAAVAGSALAIALPATGIGSSLGLAPPRSLALAGIVIITGAYLLALQAGKTIYRRASGRWL